MRQGTHRIAAAALLAPALALGLAACGKTTIDQDKLESEISKQLNVTVTCPKDQEAKKGVEFQCVGTAVNTNRPPGSSAPATDTVRIQVEVQNSDGDVRLSKVE